MSAPSRLALRSLTIHRYEQFRDCHLAELDPGDNLILGAVACGMFKRVNEDTKTNHLDFSEIAPGVKGSFWKAYESKQRGAGRPMFDLDDATDHQ